MKCPVCDVPLSISSREGVEIDFCPQCRGVWLDRGELDKVIERASAAMAPAASSGRGREYGDEPGRGRERYEDSRRYEDNRRYEDDRRRYDEDDRRGDKKRKKRSFLDDLFEIGD
jgi:Zn-finger nucleic acid-binding protein